MFVEPAFDPCPGWIYSSRFDACYLSLNSSFSYNWSASRTACYNADGQSELLVLDQKDEDQFIYDNFWKKFVNDSWIGAIYANSKHF